jgi:hypothetical protein
MLVMKFNNPQIFVHILSWSYRHKSRKWHYTVQVFIDRLLRKILKVFWPNIISNEEMWRHAPGKPVAVPLKLWKWKWIRHTLRRNSSAAEDQALSRNPPRTTKKRETKEEQKQWVRLT